MKKKFLFTSVVLIIAAVGIVCAPIISMSVTCDGWAYSEYEDSSYGTCPAPGCSCEDEGPWSHKYSILNCWLAAEPDCPFESCMTDSITLYNEWICDACPECYFKDQFSIVACSVCPDNNIFVP